MSVAGLPVRVTLLLVLLSMLFAATTGVERAAAALPAAIDEQIEAVAEWAYRGGTTNRYPSCATTCSELWTAEHDPAPSHIFARELWSEMSLLREEVEVLPNVGTVLGSRELEATPQTFGLRIGGSEGSREIWLEVELPGAVPPPPGEHGAEPDKYEVGWANRGGEIYGVRLAHNTWIINGRYGMFLSYEFQTDCGPGASGTGYVPPIGYLLGQAYGTTWCWPEGYSPVYVYALRHPVTSPSEDYDRQTAPTTVEYPFFMNDPGQSTVEERIESQLEERADEYPILIAWLDHHLGGVAQDPLDELTYMTRHEPTYEYDPDETFYLQDAESFTANWEPFGGRFVLSTNYDNILFNGLGEEEEDVLAAAGSPGGPGLPPELTLELLGGEESDAEYIDARGDDLETYSGDSLAMRGEGFDNALYSRVVQDPDDGKVWVQYWEFFYANAFDTVGFGVHEGDWEMIQVGLNELGRPDAVTLATHEDGMGCVWPLVEQSEENDQSPLVYVGAGSHASYPHAGVTPLTVLEIDDLHRGGDQADVPPLVPLGELTPWLAWEGRWGGSTEGDFQSPINISRQGDKWSHPSTFHHDNRDPYGCE